jgi:hypothetical protein
MHEPYRCVFVANGQLHAEQVRSFLASENIATEARGEALSKTHGLTLDGLGRVEILVAPADEDRARAALAAAEKGDFELPEDSDPEPTREG